MIRLAILLIAIGSQLKAWGERWKDNLSPAWWRIEHNGHEIKLLMEKRGVGYVRCCPFHDEKTPSFIVTRAGRNSQRGFWHCFSCGIGGNAYKEVKDE